jgi:hypothetical protein
VPGHGRCHSALRCLAGGLPCPGNRGTMDAVACRKSTRGKRRSQRSRPCSKPAEHAQPMTGLVGGALAAGGRACQHRGPDPSTLGAWENQAPTMRPPAARIRQDSAEVVGAAADPSGPAEGGGAAAYHPPGTVDAADPCRRDRSPGRLPAGSSLGARQARRRPQQAMARRRASTRERWCGWAIPPRLPPCASARHGRPGRRHRGRLGRASPGGVELVEERAWILLC